MLYASGAGWHDRLDCVPGWLVVEGGDISLRWRLAGDPGQAAARPSLRLAIPGRLRGIDDIGAGDLRARLFEGLALIVRASLLQPVIGGLDDLRPLGRALAEGGGGVAFRPARGALGEDRRGRL